MAEVTPEYQYVPGGEYENPKRLIDWYDVETEKREVIHPTIVLEKVSNCVRQEEEGLIIQKGLYTAFIDGTVNACTTPSE